MRLQQCAVRMTSNSSKIITNKATGQVFQAKNTKEKEETNPIKKVHSKKEDHSRGEAMVEEVYTIRQNDPRYRPEQHDNRKRNIS